MGESFADSGIQCMFREQLGTNVYDMDNDPAMLTMVLERMGLGCGWGGLFRVLVFGVE